MNDDLVGWPPVKRMRIGDGSSDSRRRSARCVKVMMEGVAIGRKVDLFRLHSYHDLFRALHEMFPAGRRHAGNNKMEEGAEGDQLEQTQHVGRSVTYEDGDGDWMLVGNVPWETFIWSAKRLKIRTLLVEHAVLNMWEIII